jgi:glutathione synthase/RimK-type ligase-like ATP-grasp enzyme
MSRPRIAIATCAGYGDPKVDDRVLAEALATRMVYSQPYVWDGEQPDWSDFDACLIRSTWDYHDKHDEFLAWTRAVAAETRLWNPPELVAWNSNKTYLRELSRRGARIVPTVWVQPGSGVQLEEVMEGEDWDEAILKPVVDLGARNLRRVRSGESFGALEDVLRRGEAMVQPFLPSVVEQGELSLIYIDGRMTHAVRKRPAPGDFRVQSIWGGTVERAEPGAAEMELADRALAQLDEAPLYARVDLVAGLDGEPCLIELELIEPNLYLTEHPPAAEALAAATLRRL